MVDRFRLDLCLIALALPTSGCWQVLGASRKVRALIIGLVPPHVFSVPNIATRCAGIRHPDPLPLVLSFVMGAILSLTKDRV